MAIRTCLACDSNKSILTARFDSREDVLERWPFALGRAHGDPTDLTAGGDYEGCGPRDVVCIHGQRVIHAVSVRHCAGFIEEYRERVFPLLNVLLAFEPTVDFLRGDEYDGRPAFLKFVVSRLKLSQLPVAVGSPGSTEEYQHERLAAVIGEAEHVAFGRGKGEVGGGVACVQSIGG